MKHIAKLRDAPFRNMDHGERAFVKDSKTYGLDKPLPEVCLNLKFEMSYFKETTSKRCPTEYR